MLPSVFTALAAGIQSLATAGAATFVYIMSIMAVGSAVLVGDLYFMTDQTTTPAIYLDSQEAVVFQADGDVEFQSGDLVFSSTRNAHGCLVYGTDYIECYSEATFAATGASTPDNLYPNVASILNPYTGSGAIDRVTVECDQQPVATNVSIGTVAATTSSGTNIASKFAIGSGSVFSASGASLDTLWENGYYIKVSASELVATPEETGTSNCKLRVWSHEHYDA